MHVKGAVSDFFLGRSNRSPPTFRLFFKTPPSKKSFAANLMSSHTFTDQLNNAEPQRQAVASGHQLQSSLQ